MQQTTVQAVRVAWARAAPDDRREAGRALIRALATQLAPHADLRIEQRCPVCGARTHGRPVLPGAPVRASVAYADPWVVVAVVPAQNARAIGIDAELEVATPDLAALFAPHDPPDLRGWTAIEAVLKADGRGLLVAPDQVLLAPDGTATVPGGSAFRVCAVQTAPGLIVTLAVRG